MSNKKSIKRLEIKNFQSHKHTVIDFSEGVNIVTGTSNAGKSAINRAIVWALSNKPRGDNFIRKNTGFAYVKIDFSDGTQIYRFRGSEENFAKTTDKDGNTKKYEKFGQEYPVELKKFLGIPRGADVIGDIYYASQTNKYFLVNLSTADLPRAIGYLAGSDVMESATKNIIQDSKLLKKDLVRIEAEKTIVQKKVKSYGKLDYKIDLINKSNLIKNQILEIQSKLGDAEAILSTHPVLEQNIFTINYDLEKIPDFTDDIKIISRLKELLPLHRDRTELYDKFKLLYAKQDNFQARLDKLNLFFSQFKKKSLTSLKNKLQENKEYQALIDSFNKLTTNKENIDSKLDDIEKKTKELSLLIKENRKTLQDAGFTCNVCGQKIK